MLRRLLVSLSGCALLAAAQAAPPPPPPPPLPVVQSESLISDAERAMAAGDDSRCEQLIARIPTGTLNAARLARVQILRAQIGLKRNLPQAALLSLPPSSAHVPMYAPAIEQLRADALFGTGDPVDAVRALVMRQTYLQQDAAAVSANQERIWSGLLATPLPPDTPSRIPQLDSIARPWIELALLMQQNAPVATLRDFASRNAGHPAAEKAKHVRPKPPPVAVPGMGVAAGGGATSQSVPALGVQGGYALLVPLSGSLGSSGTTLRDGFVWAWYAERSSKPPMHIYDAGATGAQALNAYQLAVRNGATLVVGPLTKEGLAAIAASGNTPVPVLGLNYLDNGVVPAGFLQFGLAPEDEARAAAQQAINDKRMNALVIAPSNEWGERVAGAFSAAYTLLGGQILQSARFAPGAQDFGKPLQDLMNLDQSVQRHKALTVALGETSEFEPRPRTDADVVFAPARASEARVLMPQLDFFRASNLPIYSVAAAYTGSSRELDGLTVCDMPWMLGGGGGGQASQSRREASEEFADEIRSQPRLFAMGADAFRVAQAWSKGQFEQGRDLEGATGRLRVEVGGRVVRDVSCGTIRDGRLASATP